MSDISSQIKDLGSQAQGYCDEVSRIVEQLPIFKTPELVEMVKAMKIMLIETSRMTFTIVGMAAETNQSRLEIQEELDRGKFVIKSLQEQIKLIISSTDDVDTLRKELDLEREHRQAAEKQAELATMKIKDLAPDSENSVATGLTFPYATNELKAMQGAALTYWSGHTPDKRQPTQKEVGHELCKLLSLPLQSGGEPARKAMILATAIKPDTLPHA